jgi:hypothetical protein
MKDFIRNIIISVLSGLLIFSGCKYDVTEPLWDKPYQEPPIPEITSIQPVAAPAGVNYITINGLNFLNVADSAVYFDKVQTEVISATETEIVVRRPKIFGDSLFIKVIPSGTLVSARYSDPYPVDRVIFEYGEYTMGTALNVVFTDGQNNLYVIHDVAGTRNIDKITPDGEKTTLAVQANRKVSDAVLGPDGRIYLLGDNRNIDAIDLSMETGETNWFRLPQGRFAKTAAFDAEGYLYLAGNRTPLYIIDPLLNTIETTYYEGDITWFIRVYNNALYLLVEAALPDAQTPEWAIWKHELLGSGNISDKSLVYDLTQNGIFDDKVISAMNISADGVAFLSTYGKNPLIGLDLNSGEVDYFYKNLLPGHIKHFAWGTDNNIYTAVYDSTFIDPDYGVTALHERLFKIDVGVAAGN